MAEEEGEIGVIDGVVGVEVGEAEGAGCAPLSEEEGEVCAVDEAIGVEVGEGDGSVDRELPVVDGDGAGGEYAGVIVGGEVTISSSF